VKVLQFPLSPPRERVLSIFSLSPSWERAG